MSTERLMQDNAITSDTFLVLHLQVGSYEGGLRVCKKLPDPGQIVSCGPSAPMGGTGFDVTVRRAEFCYHTVYQGFPRVTSPGMPSHGVYV